MKIMLTKLALAAVILLVLPVHSASAAKKLYPKAEKSSSKAEKAYSKAEKPFPHKVPALLGSLPEGFAIGKGHTAYNGSVDGSIYKVDLRSGVGEILNKDEIPDPFDCLKLGMRVDSRTNYLFVAGCVYGNAHVYDADSGDKKGEYQLGPDGEFALINDVAITKDAAFFTDSYLPYIYRLPLARNGGLPPNADDVTEIVLPDEFILDPENDNCCGGNGIVATPNGKTLIVGHSARAALYRVDPATDDVFEILVDPPLLGSPPYTGFIDGLVLHGRTLYILTPGDNPDGDYPDGVLPQPDMIQVVELDKEMLTGNFLGIITDPDLSGVASGALFGKSLYVNNAHYDAFDMEGNILYFERWITKLNRHAVEPVE